MVKFYCDRCEREFTNPDIEDRKFEEELQPGDIQLNFPLWIMKEPEDESEKKFAQRFDRSAVQGAPFNLCIDCRRQLKALIQNFIKPDEDESLFSFTPSEGDVP